MKTNKSRFTEDDIRRELPPDVFSLLHDLAYLNPHRSSLRQSVISFINGARAALRMKSDGDIDAQLLAHEHFTLDRACDVMCCACDEGDAVTLTTGRFAYYGHAYKNGFERCPANAIHALRARWEAKRVEIAKFNASATVLPPDIRDAEGRN